MRKPGDRAIIMVFITLLGIFFFVERAGAQEGTIEYKSEDLRNPFEEEKIETKVEGPKEEKEARPLPELRVQGVIWGGKIPQAIINDEVVTIGDTIEGARVADISKSGVTVFFDDRQYNLTTSSATGSKGSKDGAQATGKNP